MCESCVLECESVYECVSCAHVCVSVWRGMCYIKYSTFSPSSASPSVTEPQCPGGRRGRSDRPEPASWLCHVNK